MASFTTSDGSREAPAYDRPYGADPRSRNVGTGFMPAVPDSRTPEEDKFLESATKLGHKNGIALLNCWRNNAWGCKYSEEVNKSIAETLLGAVVCARPGIDMVMSAFVAQPTGTQTTR